MPIITRSQNKKQQQQQQQQEDSEYEISVHVEHNTSSEGKHRAIRRVKITTPSFIEASTRTYKVYSANIKPKSGSKKTLTEAIQQAKAEAEAADAAEVLVSLQNTTGSDTSCMNPMTQVSIYMYRIAIYNISQTVHYKTAYILYDKKNCLYHVYSIVSNQIHATNRAASASESSADTRTEFTLPLPTNTVQFTYKSYIEDTIVNFMMTMIVPSNGHDYYIQDDIFGLVIDPSEFQEKAFNENSCYYDIEDIVYDETSSETTNGFKAFMMIPSRHFWYWPANTVVTATSTAAYHDNIYTSQLLKSVLTILSCSD